MAIFNENMTSDEALSLWLKLFDYADRDEMLEISKEFHQVYNEAIDRELSCDDGIFLTSHHYVDMPIPEEYLKPKEKEYIDGMKEYINKLKALPKDEAEKEAKEALIKTGVLNKDGMPKEKIVTIE